MIFDLSIKWNKRFARIQLKIIYFIIKQHTGSTFKQKFVVLRKVVTDFAGRNKEVHSNAL